MHSNANMSNLHVEMYNPTMGKSLSAERLNLSTDMSDCAGVFQFSKYVGLRWGISKHVGLRWGISISEMC